MKSPLAPNHKLIRVQGLYYRCCCALKPTGWQRYNELLLRHVNSGAPYCLDIFDHSLLGDPSSHDSMCLCDADWIGWGDYISYPLSNCITHTITLRVLWSISLFVITIGFLYSWAIVLSALGGCNSIVRPYNDSKRHAIVAGAAANGGGGDQIDIDVEQQHRRVPTNCELFMYRLKELFAFRPLRVSLIFTVFTSFAIAAAVFHINLQFTGYDLGPTICLSIAAPALWTGVFETLKGVLLSNISMLRLNPSDRDQVDSILRVFYGLLWYGQFCVCMLVMGPILIYTLGTRVMTPVTIAYGMAQASMFTVCAVGGDYTFRRLIAVLEAHSTPQSSMQNLHAGGTGVRYTRGGAKSRTGTIAAVAAAIITTAPAPRVVAVDTPPAVQPQPQPPQPVRTDGAATAAAAATGAGAATTNNPAIAVVVVAPAGTSAAAAAAAAASSGSNAAVGGTHHTSSGGEGSSDARNAATNATAAPAVLQAVPPGLSIQKERTAFISRLKWVRRTTLRVAAQNITIYTLFSLWPMLRTCLSYSAPILWISATVSAVGFQILLKSLRCDRGCCAHRFSRSTVVPVVVMPNDPNANDMQQPPQQPNDGADGGDAAGRMVDPISRFADHTQTIQTISGPPPPPPPRVQ